MAKKQLLHIYIAAFVVVLNACFAWTTFAQTAVQGSIDLWKADITKVINLSGGWRASDKLNTAEVTQFNFDDSNWQIVDLPSPFSDQGFATEGEIWYRLTIRMPESGTLKGFVENAGHAHTIYASTPNFEPAIVASSGVPHSDLNRISRSREPVLFELPQDSLVVLTWRVANVGYAVGGPYYPIQVASSDVLATKVATADKIEFAFFWVYFLFGLYFVTNWNWNRDDWQSLSVGLLSLCMALRTAAVSGQLEGLIPGFTFEQRIIMEGISFTLLLGIFPLMVLTFFPKEFAPLNVGKWKIQPPRFTYLLVGPETTESLSLRKARLMKFNWIVVIGGSLLAIVGTIIVLFSSPFITSKVMVGARFFALLLAPQGLIICAMAYERGSSMASGILFGVVFMLAGTVHDVLASMHVITGYPDLVGFTFVIFILILGFAIARRNEQYAAQLKSSMADAKKASVAKSQFLTSISHEIRTPLTAILGYSQLIESELTNSESEEHEDHLEFVTVIRLSGERLLLLVNDLLDMSKAETGRLDLKLEEQSVVTAIDDVVRQVYPLVNSKNLSITFEDPGEGLIVFADSLRLKQVILNIVSNAIKFTEEGGITIKVFSEVHFNTQWCTITVADTGPGISKKFLPLVFERFTQEGRTYDSAQRGTGLGLAISRELLERMGGNIRVSSEVGLGSIFRIELPLYRRESDEDESSGLTIGSEAA